MHAGPLGAGLADQSVLALVLGCVVGSALARVDGALVHDAVGDTAAERGPAHELYRRGMVSGLEGSRERGEAYVDAGRGGQDGVRRILGRLCRGSGSHGEQWMRRVEKLQDSVLVRCLDVGEEGVRE